MLAVVATSVDGVTDVVRGVTSGGDVETFVEGICSNKKSRMLTSRPCVHKLTENIHLFHSMTA